MENNTTIVSAFRKFLTERAAKEGVDVSALQIEGVTTDRTWGDKVGFVFFGCSDEVNERVAACFERFAAKHMTSGSYEAQRSDRSPGPALLSRVQQWRQVVEHERGGQHLQPAHHSRSPDRQRLHGQHDLLPLRRLAPLKAPHST